VHHKHPRESNHTTSELEKEILLQVMSYTIVNKQLPNNTPTHVAVTARVTQTQ
jgi:hypothetical protein